MTEPLMPSLGRYTIHAEIGKGGFATVYRATDTVLERDVALKVLKPGWTDDAKAVERFMREARLASRLKHPNIVTIFDVGQVEGRLFIAMELVRGRSLQQIITEDGLMAWSRVLAVLEQSAAALDYAHAEGLVHRDIKPANIILDESKPGSAVHVMLTDFGLVRGAEQASLSMGTTGGLLGTPEYIPPEIWDGEPAAKASDIYALGCVAFYLLTGKVLFSAATPMAVLKRHAEGPVFPQQWPSGVPAGAEAVLRRALAKEPDQRQASAAELAAGLRACEEQAAREQEAMQKEEAERAAQIALAAEAARRAEEERARQEAERKAKEEAERQAREEQERQRQAELAAQVAVAEKAKQEAEERERQRQARESAKFAEETQRRELAATQQTVVAKPAQSTQTATPPAKAESNKMWLYVGGVVVVIIIAILFVAARPFGGVATPALLPTQPPAAQPTQAPTLQPTAAPVKPTEAPTATAAPVTITWWHINTDEKFKALWQKLADEYMTAHPNVKIEITALENEAFKSKLTTAMQSGAPPDLFQSWGGSAMNDYANAGLLKDITANVQGAWGDSFGKGALGVYSHNGKQYGVPWDMSIVGFWYNKEFFDMVGIRTPETWTELLDVVKILKDAGITPIALGGKDKWPGAFWWEYLATRIGGKEAFDAAYSRTGAFTDQPFIDAGKKLQELIALKPFQDGFLEADYASEAKLMANGQAAMELMGSWAKVMYSSQTAIDLGDKLGWFPFPMVAGGKGNPSDALGDGNGIVVAKNAPAEAVDFLKYLTSVDAQRAIAESGFGRPVVKGAEVGMSDPLLKQIQAGAAAAPYFQLYYDVYMPPAVGSVMLNSTQGIFAGTMTPEQVAQAIEDSAAQQLK